MTNAGAGAISATNSAGGEAYGVLGLNAAMVSNASTNGITASTTGSDAYGVYGGAAQP